MCICMCQVTLSAARPEVDKRRERLGLSVEEIIEFNARDDGGNEDDDTEAGSEAVGTATTMSPQAKKLSALNSKTEVDAYVVATPAALLPW